MDRNTTVHTSLFGTILKQGEAWSLGARLYKFAALLAVTIAVAEAQESATVSVPDIAKAGEVVNLDITLDKAPSIDGGFVGVSVTGPNNFTTQSGCEVNRGERGCRYAFRLPDDAPGGTWYVSKLWFFTGSRQIDLPFEKLQFKVIPLSGLIFPSSAQVAVNPSQVQLLRREATRLQTEIQTLKAAVADAQASSSARDTLRRRVQSEIVTLDSTESQFSDLSRLKQQTDSAKAFFDDLRTSYKDVLASLGSEKSGLEAAGLVLATAWSPSISPGDGPGAATYSLAAQAVFRVIEQNELAYSLVADTGTLTFDLEVSSSPEGAVVSYHRRGDPYQNLPNPTNSVIKALPYAIWIVRFQMPGYLDKEVEHDPFRESNHSVNTNLIKR